jgi:uncharacterized MAPEG superfamily protein
MSSSTSTSAPPKKNNGGGSPPPPALAILAVYLVLGAIISYGFGRPPGSLPAKGLLTELAPSFIVLAVFLTYYELADCMGTGLARARQAAGHGRVYDEYAAQIHVPPEPVYLAQRAQTNQMEQFPVLLVGTLGCALYVNGAVAALLAAVWSLLRIQYSLVYRQAVGVTQDVLFQRLGRYTIPAYFCANALVTATAIHTLRAVCSGDS